MKTFYGLILLLFTLTGHLLANGVCIVDASNDVYFKLQSTHIDVSTESQIAIIKSTQVFKNDLGEEKALKYAFPLPEGASAINLRWEVYGQWYQANIAATPQDTTLPGSGGTISQNLIDYLGDIPLYFNIPDTLKADSLIIVELTYVELLPYKFGKVDFSYPNDYQLIQADVFEVQELNFSLVSPRSITEIHLLSNHPLSQISNTGNEAFIKSVLNEAPANDNYHIQYSLDLNQLGLFDYSTFIPDSLVPDSLGDGFFAFIAEPDPGSTTEVIDKVFTLMIDRSGSMGGNKIVQARNAASFIVENLNVGDKFNIVDFASNISSFQNQHVLFNPQNQTAALNYISGLNASGLTNISGAFDVAVPQFSTANDSTANIIIFFTDGNPTTGITNIQQLVVFVHDLILSTETNVMVFTFGIGNDVNQQLLTLLAAQNNGIAEFLGNDELYSRITEFYLMIRNPVLLNTEISFDPPIVSEVYPNPLPNLYKGQQMVVTGRYQQPGTVVVELSGDAFAQPVSYQYTMDLADSMVANYQFLTKIWAKKKIEYLLVQYYSFDPNSPQAQALKEEIISLSIAYGVITPFTSFSGGTPVGIETEETMEHGEITAQSFELLGNYPNPFNPSTIIRIRVNHPYSGPLTIKIYNTLGQLVRVLMIESGY
jgi:Ca-activated chloride channel family protein